MSFTQKDHRVELVSWLVDCLHSDDSDVVFFGRNFTTETIIWQKHLHFQEPNILVWAPSFRETSNQLFAIWLSQNGFKGRVTTKQQGATWSLFVVFY